MKRKEYFQTCSMSCAAISVAATNRSEGRCAVTGPSLQLHFACGISPLLLSLDGVAGHPTRISVGPGAGSHPFGAHNTRLSPDSCPGKILLRGLKESGAGMPEQDKDPRVQENPDDQRRVPVVTGDARSAFRPLRDNGGVSPFVPRPGPLQRDLHAQRSEVRYKQTSQTSWTSSCTKRNAISSSYSSTGGFPWLKRRRMGGPASSHCQLTLSSSKTVSEARPQAVPSGHTQCEKAAGTTPGQTLTPRTGSPRSQTSRPRRRKFPLLPRRRGEPLMLPPPLELGFRVTAEDLDLEKEAAFQCINSVLRGEAKAIWDCRPSRPSHALSSLATGTSGLPAVSKAPRMDAQQERDKSQDSRGPVAPLASVAEAPSTAPVSRKKHRPPGPLFSFSDPLPATSSHSQDPAQVTSLIPAPLPAASMDGGMRSPRPGTSAPAAAAAAPPPPTLTPMSGSLLVEWMEALHISGPQPQVQQVPRGQVRYNQRSQTSCMSSCPKRNAISSSYSSTGGFPWLKRRRRGGPASSHCQLTLSSSKTVSEARPQAASSGHTQCEKVADTTPGQTFAPRTGSPRSQASRPRRRKFPLLPRRRGEPLMLPPPLQLGFRVTAEDLDLEKEAAFQCINSVLRGEAKAIWDCRPSRPSHALSSLATGASGLPAVSKAPNMDAQQERHKS
ncbi:LOW QUALITY PROTEIN: putative POM121-like protein 1 [Macaca nemestrina]|uniref:LOW QUALITY PROTEIN: putative POM121-like protein 1 n=1 Tax=Macaca nemestrina TaxID=9545 RepID=UPI0039B9A54B